MAAKKIVWLNDKEIFINFRHYFKPEHFELENDEELLVSIDMSKRRVFHKLIKTFVDEIQNTLAACPSVRENYFIIAKNIQTGEYENTDEDKERLIKDIDENILANDEIQQYFYDFVEENYKNDIEGSDTKNKENSLQFKNDYAKRIFSCSMMSRFSFPLLCSFMKANNIKKEETTFLNLVNEIFPYYSFDDNGVEIDLLVKIQKFVATSVENTLYSDRIIWNYLKNLSITEKSLSIDIHRNILHSIIPKLDITQSVIAFFHVIIKRQIDYQFTSKFQFEYKPITIIQTGNDTINPFVKVEQRLLKNSSEMDIVMMNLDIENFIKKHDKLNKNDLEYFKSNIAIHSAQTRILGFFINRHIGRGISVMSLNKEEYIKLLFIVKNWLEENNYIFLTYILLGKPVPKTTVKRNFHKGKFFIEITQSKRFNEITKKYTNLGDKVDKDTIISFIGSIINTDFEFLKMPDGTIYQPEFDENNNLKPLKQSIVELLNFVDSL